MTREHAIKEREAFNAFCDGKTIQAHYVFGGEWWDIGETESAYWTQEQEHRIKPVKVPLGPEDVHSVTYAKLLAEKSVVEQNLADMTNRMEAHWRNETSLRESLKDALEVSSKYEDRYFAERQLRERAEAELKQYQAAKDKLSL
jgi:hypothetical protein